MRFGIRMVSATLAGVAGGLLLQAGVASAGASRPSWTWTPAYSGNYTASSSRTIDRIVIHTVEGSYQGCISWFRNPASNVSAHYVVSLRGDITKMLRDSDIGWHCRTWNYRAIGIENEGYAYRNTWTDAQYDALAHLVAYLCDLHNVPIDRTHIVGHVEVPGNTHTDPGPHFDWARFMRMVREKDRGPGGQTPPPSPAPSPSPSPAARGGEVTASRLNVRAGAWGTILGQVGSGDRFVLTGRTSGDWRQIWWSGRSAWVHGSYLRGASGTGAEVTVDALNVRTGPSTGHSRIGLIRRGQRYFHLASGAGGSWRKLQLDDRPGWSYSPYTRSVPLGR
jgi:uncharacterized protein YraI